MADAKLKEFMENLPKKRIRLEAGTPYPSHMKVEILDFPKGEDARDAGGNQILRRRFEIDVEYADEDIKPLIAEGKDEAGILEHYKDWMYSLVRQLLSSEWEAESGMEEIIQVLKAKIREHQN